MSKHIRLALILTAGLTALAAPAESVRGQILTEPPSEEADSTRGLELVVRNENFADMRIYVTRVGLIESRIRLGNVSGFQTRRFSVPSQFKGQIDQLQFIAQPIGGNVTVISEAFPNYEVGRVEWLIQQALNQSGTVLRGN